MTKRTVADLLLIAQYGGGFELDASDYTVADLSAVARVLCNSATMRLRKVEKISAADLASIAQHGAPGTVQFVFAG